MTADRSHIQIMLVLPHEQKGQTYSRALTDAGFSVATVASGDEALALVRRESFDIVFLCHSPGGGSGALGLVREFVEQPLHPLVIVLSDRDDMPWAVAYIKAGAHDCVRMPDGARAIVDLAEAAARDALPRLDADGSAANTAFVRAFLLSSVAAVRTMAATFRLVSQHPRAHAVVLGEPGAGKRLLCQLIHSRGGRPLAPLLRMPLDKTPPSRVEESLFGAGDLPGVLRQAAGGTLVLEEITALDVGLQRRLADVLTAQRTRQDLHRSARVLATTRRSAAELVSSLYPGLLWSLGSSVIHMPALRDRAEDIPALASAVLAQVAADAGRPSLRFSPHALGPLRVHTWPGNLKELRAVLSRVALTCPEDLVSSDVLAQALERPPPQSERAADSGGSRSSKSSSRAVPRISGIVAAGLDSAARAERERIEAALVTAGGHRERAAVLLGMSRTTLWTRMRMLGVDHDRFRGPRSQNA